MKIVKSLKDSGLSRNIMKIVKSFKDSSLLINGVSETIQSEAKEQKGGFLSMLSGTLGTLGTTSAILLLKV